jgi:hypothetical protein
MDELMSRRDDEDEVDYDAVTSSTTVTVHPSRAMTPFEFCEDDGPLNVIYKKVFSIEICQIPDDDNDEHGISLTNPTSARRRRHAVRRIRVFFYNRYAEAMSTAVRHLREHSPEKSRSVPLLMSLSNVPAICIVPLSITPSGCHPRLQQYILNPFGDEAVGLSSPYCICIGDKSAISYDPSSENLSFNCRKLEVRLVETPVNRVLADVVDEENNFFEDAIITAHSVQKLGNGYFTEASDLVKRYSRIQSHASIPEPMTLNLEDEVVADVAPNAGIPGLRKCIATSIQAEANSSTTEDCRKSGSDPCLRPNSVTSLHNLHSMLLRNGTKHTVTVWAVALGFTPPSLTTTREWKMSIVLVDETLPLSNSVGTPGVTGKTTEMHVPSVTLMLFSKDKSKLPIVRSAGDVVLCEKVILQAWNGEPQLTTKKNVSKIVIVRPSQPRCPGYPLPGSIAPHDWSVIGDQQCFIHYSFVNYIWCWGQKRFSEDPTMSPNCYLSIGGIGDHNSNLDASTSGDLTAAVTAIIPMPEHLRHRDTPRGELL